jgi:hypothetical protein
MDTRRELPAGEWRIERIVVPASFCTYLLREYQRREFVNELMLFGLVLTVLGAKKRRGGGVRGVKLTTP